MSGAGDHDVSRSGPEDSITSITEGFESAHEEFRDSSSDGFQSAVEEQESVTCSEHLEEIDKDETSNGNSKGFVECDDYVEFGESMNAHLPDFVNAVVILKSDEYGEFMLLNVNEQDRANDGSYDKDDVHPEIYQESGNQSDLPSYDVNNNNDCGKFSLDANGNIVPFDKENSGMLLSNEISDSQVEFDGLSVTNSLLLGKDIERRDFVQLSCLTTELSNCKTIAVNEDFTINISTKSRVIEYNLPSQLEELYEKVDLEGTYDCAIKNFHNYIPLTSESPGLNKEGSKLFVEEKNCSDLSNIPDVFHHDEVETTEKLKQIGYVLTEICPECFSVSVHTPDLHFSQTDANSSVTIKNVKSELVGKTPSNSSLQYKYVFHDQIGSIQNSKLSCYPHIDPKNSTFSLKKSITDDRNQEPAIGIENPGNLRYSDCRGKGAKKGKKGSGVGKGGGGGKGQGSGSGGSGHGSGGGGHGSGDGRGHGSGSGGDGGGGGNGGSGRGGCGGGDGGRGGGGDGGDDKKDSDEKKNSDKKKSGDDKKTEGGKKKNKKRKKGSGLRGVKELPVEEMEPVAGAEEGPCSATKEPGAETKEPGAETEVPCTETEVPCTETEVPCTETEVPCTETEVPCTETEVHGAETEVHGAETEVHGAETEVHGAETEVHGAETEVHGAETEVHGAETEGHVAETEGHVAETEGHVAETEGHVAETEGHVAETEGHVAETEGHGVHGESSIKEKPPLATYEYVVNWASSNNSSASTSGTSSAMGHYADHTVPDIDDEKKSIDDKQLPEAPSKIDGYQKVFKHKFKRTGHSSGKRSKRCKKKTSDDGSTSTNKKSVEKTRNSGEVPLNWGETDSSKSSCGRSSEMSQHDHSKKSNDSDNEIEVDGYQSESKKSVNITSNTENSRDSTVIIVEGVITKNKYFDSEQAAKANASMKKPNPIPLEKAKRCVFCKDPSHIFKVGGQVTCPILKRLTCILCEKKGEHSLKYCPQNPLYHGKPIRVQPGRLPKRVRQEILTLSCKVDRWCGFCRSQHVPDEHIMERELPEGVCIPECRRLIENAVCIRCDADGHCARYCNKYHSSPHAKRFKNDDGTYSAHENAVA